MMLRVSSYLLELLDGTLVNSTALVDQVCEKCEHVNLTVAHWSDNLRPVVVDLPESTWPITTTLIWFFSLLCPLSITAL